MKVLIPAHYSTKQIDQIRDISPEIEVVLLQRSKDYFFWKGIWWLLRNYLPYSLYEKWKIKLDKSFQRNWYTINSDNEKECWKQIEVFLCSADVNQNLMHEYLRKLTSLKWIHSTHTGIDNILSNKSVRDDILLTNIGNVNSRRVAEFVMALVLYGLKNISLHEALQKHKYWHGVSSREFGETTLGILGLGNIGQEVAKLASHLNIKVVATKRNPIEMDNVDVLRSEEYHYVLKVADYVVITLPLTRDTEGLIGEKELRIMNKKACLINVSRGNIVKEEALIKALREKWIDRAFLDVVSDEPLTKNSPFYSLKNVLITHHSSYASRNSMKEIFDVFLENLRRYVSGAPLLNVIRKERGY